MASGGLVQSPVEEQELWPKAGELGRHQVAVDARSTTVALDSLGCLGPGVFLICEVKL